MSVKLQRILYPTDFSEFSLCALPFAAALAQKFEAEIHCLHVVDEPYHCWMGAGESAAPLVVSREDLWQSAQQQMIDFSERHLSSIEAPLQSKMVSGRPFVEIIRYAREEKTDLIVIATHGRGGLASMLLGSVTEKVVRKSPCPVLTVRHPGHKFVMP